MRTPIRSGLFLYCCQQSIPEVREIIQRQGASALLSIVNGRLINIFGKDELLRNIAIESSGRLVRIQFLCKSFAMEFVNKGISRGSIEVKREKGGSSDPLKCTINAPSNEVLLEFVTADKVLEFRRFLEERKFKNIHSRITIQGGYVFDAVYEIFREICELLGFSCESGTGASGEKFMWKADDLAEAIVYKRGREKKWENKSEAEYFSKLKEPKSGRL